MIELLEYVRPDGSSPYRKWLSKIDAAMAIKVTAAQARLELGNLSNIKWFDGIGEYRINWGPGVRLYLAQDGKQLIILFGGGTKKTQAADIKRAKGLLKEYKSRKNERKLEPKTQQPKTKKRKKRK